ncbi:MAG: ion transporter [Pseudomonadota bacterium]|nr:ion transporter [Pseudomonadota bacterium]
MVRIRDRIFQLLEKAQPGDIASLVVDRGLAFLIVANVIAVTLETVDEIYQAYAPAFTLFEIISVIIFLIEYLLRIWVSASNNASRFDAPFRRRLSYMLSPSGMIDLLAILPAFLPFFTSVDLRWLRILRLLRMFKISHYSSALEDFFSAIYHERTAFAGALYLFCVTLFLSSALMYLVEHSAQPEVFSSIPETLWWSLITLTTVGYGDVAPITAIGKVIGGITAFMGVCVVALMTGIVASAFSSQVSRRQDLLEAEIMNALDDGVITEDELEKITELQNQLNLEDHHLKAILELVGQRNPQQSDKS